MNDTVAAMRRLLAELPLPEVIKTVQRDERGQIVRLIEGAPAINLSPVQAQAYVGAVDALLPDLVGTKPDAGERALIARVVDIRNGLARQLIPPDGPSKS